MVIALLVAGALWRGGPLLPLAITSLALHNPLPALIAAAGWAVVGRLRAPGGPTPDDEAATLERLVAELEGGASPRAALAAVARAPAPIDLRMAQRFVVAGLPSARIAPILADAFPHNGRLVAAAWTLAGETGAPAASVMGALARRAAERGRLDRERRASTAQARATAWLIAGLPLAVIVALGATGRIGPGPGLPFVVAGILLQAAGLALVGLMIRRSA